MGLRLTLPGIKGAPRQAMRAPMPMMAQPAPLPPQAMPPQVQAVVPPAILKGVQEGRQARAAQESKRQAAEQARRDATAAEQAQVTREHAAAINATLVRIGDVVSKLADVAEKSTWPRVVVNDAQGNPVRSELRPPETVQGQ